MDKIRFSNFEKLTVNVGKKFYCITIKITTAKNPTHRHTHIPNTNTIHT